jgi:3-hydroxymyristoyl/3-hydroxydecanoyl-(acyl carrier protein) dehydratase
MTRLPPTGESLPPPPRRLKVEAVARNNLSASIDFEVPYDLDIFAGHFSHVPIVPGAMLVGWAAEVGAELGIWHHGVTRAAAMKFRRIVQPGPKYHLGLTSSATGDCLDFQFESAGVVHAAGALLAPKQ